MGVLEIAQMPAAGDHIFGARRQGFGRTSARAGIAHRGDSNRFEAADSLEARPFLYILYFRIQCQSFFRNS
jgi:hypothetical protein